MKPFHVVFCVVPEFPLTSLAVGIDALRVANRMAGRPVFQWTALSSDGKPIAANCGLAVVVDGSFPSAHLVDPAIRDADLVLVVAGFNPERYCFPALLRWLAARGRRSAPIGSIASGAYVLAKAGVLEGRRCTIHWENRSLIQEQFPSVELLPHLFVVDRDIYTCAGSSSVYDMMLHLIAERAGPDVAARVAEQSLLSAIRRSEDAVRRPFGTDRLAPSPLVVRALALMARRVDERSPIEHIAAELGVSQRQLERQFRSELAETPSAYYRRLRIERASELLLQTNMSITEVGVACGFMSAAHFSRTYRRVRGLTPKADRSYHHRRSFDGRPG